MIKGNKDILLSTVLSLLIHVSIVFLVSINLPKEEKKINYIRISLQSQKRKIKQKPIYIPSEKGGMKSKKKSGFGGQIKASMTINVKNKELSRKEFEKIFDAYFLKVKEKIDPLWRSKAELFEGESDTISYKMKLLLKVQKDGKISDYKFLEKARSKIANRITSDTLQEVGYLPPPPRSILKGSNHLIMKWDFLIEKGLKTK